MGGVRDNVIQELKRQLSSKDGAEEGSARQELLHWIDDQTEKQKFGKIEDALESVLHGASIKIGRVFDTARKLPDEYYSCDTQTNDNTDVLSAYKGVVNLAAIVLPKKGGLLNRNGGVIKNLKRDQHKAKEFYTQNNFCALTNNMSPFDYADYHFCYSPLEKVFQDLYKSGASFIEDVLQDNDVHAVINGLIDDVIDKLRKKCPGASDSEVASVRARLRDEFQSAIISSYGHIIEQHTANILDKEKFSYLADSDDPCLDFAVCLPSFRSKILANARLSCQVPLLGLLKRVLAHLYSIEDKSNEIDQQLTDAVNFISDFPDVTVISQSSIKDLHKQLFKLLSLVEDTSLRNEVLSALSNNVLPILSDELQSPYDNLINDQVKYNVAKKALMYTDEINRKNAQKTFNDKCAQLLSSKQALYATYQKHFDKMAHSLQDIYQSPADCPKATVQFLADTLAKIYNAMPLKQRVQQRDFLRENLRMFEFLRKKYGLDIDKQFRHTLDSIDVVEAKQRLHTSSLEIIYRLGDSSVNYATLGAREKVIEDYYFKTSPNEFSEINPVAPVAYAVDIAKERVLAGIENRFGGVQSSKSSWVYNGAMHVTEVVARGGVEAAFFVPKLAVDVMRAPYGVVRAGIQVLIDGGRVVADAGLAVFKWVSDPLGVKKFTDEVLTNNFQKTSIVDNGDRTISGVKIRLPECLRANEYDCANKSDDELDKQIKELESNIETLKIKRIAQVNDKISLDDELYKCELKHLDALGMIKLHKSNKDNQQKTYKNLNDKYNKAKTLSNEGQPSTIEQSPVNLNVLGKLEAANDYLQVQKLKLIPKNDRKELVEIIKQKVNFDGLDDHQQHKLLLVKLAGVVCAEKVSLLVYIAGLTPAKLSECIDKLEKTTNNSRVSKGVDPLVVRQLKLCLQIQQSLLNKNTEKQQKLLHNYEELAAEKINRLHASHNPESTVKPRQLGGV